MKGNRKNLKNITICSILYILIQLNQLEESSALPALMYLRLISALHKYVHKLGCIENLSGF